MRGLPATEAPRRRSAGATWMSARSHGPERSCRFGSPRSPTATSRCRGWTATSSARAAGLTTSLREPAASGAAAPLSGRIDLSLDDRRWSLTADSRIAGAVTLAANAGGRLEETFASSTIAGRAELRAAEIDVALKRLDTAGLGTGMNGAVLGTAVAAVDLGGTIGAPRAAGTVDASNLRVGTTGPGSASVRFDARPGTLTLDAIRIEVGPNVVTGQAVVGLDAGTLNGQFDGNLPQLAVLGSEVPESWRPEGFRAARWSSGRHTDESDGGRDRRVRRSASGGPGVSVRSLDTPARRSHRHRQHARGLAGRGTADGERAVHAEGPPLYV